MPSEEDEEIESSEFSQELEVQEPEVKSSSSSEEYADDDGRTLTYEEASNCLTCVGRTFRYVNNTKTYAYPTYAYIAMKVIKRNIADISIVPSFVHVVFLDLTQNRLTDYSLGPLEDMKQLKALIVDKNLIKSTASVPALKNLQLFSLKENFVSNCEVRELEELLYLDLSYNEIAKIRPHLWCPYLLPKLQELSMRRNGLKFLCGFLFSSLVSLFLAENQITEIEGLEYMKNLKFLHLRKNPLRKLNGFTPESKKLFYLNIRDCKIESEKELKKLSDLPRLERIVVTGNPFWNENKRLQLIEMLPKLRRINKTIVDDDERQKIFENGTATNDNIDVENKQDEIL